MNDETPNTKKPSFIAYQVSEGNDGKSHFNRVGAAFEHGDGEGHNVLLDATPINGLITLRSTQERLDDLRGDDAGGNSGGQKKHPQRGQRNQRHQSASAPDYDR